MTLTSWAWQAIDTRSAWRSSVISRQPTTSASARSWVSSARAGARSKPRAHAFGLALAVLGQVPDVPLVDAQPDPPTAAAARARRHRRSRRPSRSSGRGPPSTPGSRRRSRTPPGRSRRGGTGDRRRRPAARGPSSPTSRRSASRTRSCRRRRARSTDRRGASRGRPRPRDGRSRRRSCGRSATGRPSRCRGTRSGSRTARHGRWPPAGRRPRYPTGALQYSTRSRAASAPRVPRFTASIGSTPASRAHATNSSVPTRLGSIERHARSCRSGPLVARPDAVLPVVAGHEVATRVADGRHAEPSDEVDDVVAPAIGIRRRVPRLVDPAVDRPAHVLDERPEDPFVDDADRRGRVDHRPGISQPSSRSGSASARAARSSARSGSRVAVSGRSTDEVPTSIPIVPGSTTRRWSAPV